MLQLNFRTVLVPILILTAILSGLTVTSKDILSQLTDVSPSNDSLIRVPQDYATIQGAIDAASSGDTIQVSSGTYTQPLVISGKVISLTSEFLSNEDQSFIENTIIDGGITVSNNSAGTKIIGFTIQNGSDGIQPHSAIEVRHNRIRWNQDGIDFEGGIGHILENNTFEDNRDDGIDLDGATSVTIRHNIIRNNNDDGIEIRIHHYDGAQPLEIIIESNLILNNDDDGIQIIDDLSAGQATNRLFIIKRNVVAHNGKAAMGFLDNGDTQQDFRAAKVPDPVHFLNNTVVANDHGISGSGSDLVAINNIFVDHLNIALKKVDGDSIAAFNLFWNNGVDFQDSNVDMPSTLIADPLLANNYNLLLGSPAIDSGTAFFEWKGESIVDLPHQAYFGIAPDLGQHESTFPLDQHLYLPMIR